MKGLLKKDLLLLKSQIKYIVTIVVICLIMAYANSGFAYISSYLTFMGTGLVFNSFSYDMYHNEMTYLFALPFSKKEYCLEKYIYALTVTFISWLIAFLISSATHINLETIIVQLAMLFSAFIYISITIPVMMKYGREKGNYYCLNVDAYFISCSCKWCDFSRHVDESNFSIPTHWNICLRCTHCLNHLI